MSKHLLIFHALKKVNRPFTQGVHAIYPPQTPRSLRAGHERTTSIAPNLTFLHSYNLTLSIFDIAEKIVRVDFILLYIL